MRCCRCDHSLESRVSRKLLRPFRRLLLRRELLVDLLPNIPFPLVVHNGVRHPIDGLVPVAPGVLHTQRRRRLGRLFVAVDRMPVGVRQRRVVVHLGVTIRILRGVATPRRHTAATATRTGTGSAGVVGGDFRHGRRLLRLGFALEAGARFRFEQTAGTLKNENRISRAR